MRPFEHLLLFLIFLIINNCGKNNVEFSKTEGITAELSNDSLQPILPKVEKTSEVIDERELIFLKYKGGLSLNEVNKITSQLEQEKYLYRAATKTMYDILKYDMFVEGKKFDCQIDFDYGNKQVDKLIGVSISHEKDVDNLIAIKDNEFSSDAKISSKLNEERIISTVEENNMRYHSVKNLYIAKYGKPKTQNRFGILDNSNEIRKTFESWYFRVADKLPNAHPDTIYFESDNLLISLSPTTLGGFIIKYYSKKILKEYNRALQKIENEMNFEQKDAENKTYNTI